jgi:hypothetical protein
LTTSGLLVLQAPRVSMAAAARAKVKVRFMALAFSGKVQGLCRLASRRPSLSSVKA